MSHRRGCAEQATLIAGDDVTRPPCARARLRIAVGVAAAALLTAVGCGDDGSAADDADGTTAPPTTLADSTTTTLSVEAEIEARYRELVRVITAVTADPDPDDPRLADVMVDPRLSISRDAIAGLDARNQSFEIGIRSREDVLSITVHNQNSATLVACVVAADQLIDRDTGHVIPADPVTTKDEATFVRVEGTWKISNYVTVTTWTGVRSCAD